jgi:uncharacterized protein (TIGR00645 family)
VYQFMHELALLVTKAGSLSENEVMLIVLGLIDVVMIANLLIMVIIGGYETFVSRSTSKATPTSRNGSRTSMPACSRSSWPWP